MGKALKNAISVIIILLVIVGAFVAGDYFNLNISKKPLHRNRFLIQNHTLQNK